jgi:hypothetical protein
MKKILVLVCMVLFLGTFVSAESAAAADRIVNNNDGTVTDTQTNLMWAAWDNGSSIHWANAKSYCEGYSGGGKSSWRMPTIDELGQLHNSGAYGSVIRKTGIIVWSSETSGSGAAGFDFSNGTRDWISLVRLHPYTRALPVRSGK